MARISKPIKKSTSKVTTKKTPVQKKLFNEIFLSTELFLTQLGFASWKSMKTRLSNKLGVSLRETLSANEILIILNSIVKSSSKAKNKAKEFLKLFEENKDNIENEIEKPMEEFHIPEDLMKKYQINNKDDVYLKKHILSKDDRVLDDEIEKRLELYRFEYDVRIVKLLKEMRKERLI
jgi:hypothetical protein